MGSAFVQKLVWTVLAIGVYALAAWPAMASVAEALKPLAGLIVGAVWVARPGDAKLIEVARKSIPPIACALLLFGCASAEKAVQDAQDHAERARQSAADMRSDLEQARTLIDMASTAVDMLCGFQRVAQCAAAEDVIRVLDAAHKTAATAVDTAEQLGVVLPQVSQQVSGLVQQAEALGETVRALGKEVAHAVHGRDGGAVAEQPAAAAE